MSIPCARQILDHIQASIAAILLPLGITAAQVHTLTTIQTDVSDLPDITVFGVEDKPRNDEEVTDGAGGQMRVLTFAVGIVINSLIEGDTDPLAILCRKAVLSDPYQGGLAFNTTWSTQQWGEGATSSATVATKLIFTATYAWSPEW